MIKTSTKISNNFTLEELTKGNVPTNKQKKSLIALVVNVLQPIRDNFGVPVDISSGLRSFDSNKATGGAEMSQHLLGEAVDFHVRGVKEKDAFDWIKKNVEYDQLIFEHDNIGHTWLHVSYKENRGESFFLEKETNKVTNYEEVK